MPLFILFLLSASQAAPLDTTAGRWIYSEIGLAAGERQLLSSRFSQIEARYRRSIPREDLAFTPGSVRQLSRAQRQVLEAIAREELGRPVPSYANTREIFAARTSIEVAGRLPGRHGHPSYLLRRLSGMPWESAANFRGDPFAVQGDPTWMLQTQEDVAEYLGFRLISRDLLVVPGPEELNAAISKLNVELARRGAETIPYRFKATHGNLNSRDFSALLIDNVFPYAIDGHMLAHDVSYHAGTIFLTNGQTAVARAEGRFFQAFEKFVSARHPGLHANPEVQGAFENVWRHVGVRFDLGSGGYSSLARHHHFPQSTSREIEDLLEQAAIALGAPADPFYVVQTTMAMRSPEANLFLQEAYREFAAGPGRRLLEAQSAFQARPRMQELHERIIEIGEAARALGGRSPE